MSIKLVTFWTKILEFVLTIVWIVLFLMAVFTKKFLPQKFWCTSVKKKFHFVLMEHFVSVITFGKIENGIEFESISKKLNYFIKTFFGFLKFFQSYFDFLNNNTNYIHNFD